MINIFRNSIQAKIMGMVAIILTIGFAVFAVISIRHEESDLVRQQEESNHVLATSVSNSLKTSMLAGKQELTVQAIDSLKGIGDVRQVRVFSLNGKESFGGNGILTAEAGDQLSRVMRSGERAEFYEDEGSNRVLTEIHPLPNEAACQACHVNSGNLRGAILVSTSMERVDKAVWSNKMYTVAALTLLLAIILACLWAVLSRTIVKPLRSVVSAIKRITAGDLNERVPA
ncbi:MAG: HAMP domain-containing protein, partial [Thermoleophilia bacterium]